MTEAEWIAFLQRPEIPAFNRTMLDNPADDLPRLVFADWMDENCPDVEVNAAVRESISGRNQRAKWPGLPMGRAWHLVFARGRVTAEFNHSARPVKRRPVRTLLEGVWQAGWVATVVFADHRRHFGTVANWFQDAGMSGVEAIVLDGVILVPEQLEELLASPHLTTLTSLELAGDEPGGSILRAFAAAPPLPRLRVLRLSGPAFGLGELVALAASPQVAGLRALHVTRCHVNEIAGMALANSPHLAGLTELHLPTLTMTPAGIAALANSPYLCEAIRVQWRRPTDEGGANR